jgi:hypothetical protein
MKELVYALPGHTHLVSDLLTTQTACVLEHEDLLVTLRQLLESTIHIRHQRNDVVALTR